MAARPGEENVASLVGDIHYFYGSPSAKPPHHRFDKGSYVYLFENATEHRARIEIANNPGTADQDAFDGFLDMTNVTYSYKKQCLATIAVAAATVDQSQWHLPTWDPRNENKYHYRLRELDIYFWTQSDALIFVNAIRRLLPPTQVQVLDEPGPPPHISSQYMDPLVQKLENVAISGSTYGTAQPAGLDVPTFAPAPVAPESEAPRSYAPMAYNPAAPPAPEQIRHREKTPPPEDDEVDPLRAAVAYDQAPPLTATFNAHGPLSPSVPGHPNGGHPGVTSPGFPPTQFGQQLPRAATVPVSVPVSAMTFGVPTSPYGANFPAFPGFAPPPPPSALTQQHGSLAMHSSPPPPGGLQSPGLQSPGAYPGQGLQSAGLPGAAYSNYDYGRPGPVAHNSEHSIHQQVYQPTPGEHEIKHKPKPEGRSKLGENADRLERGVSGMLKKLEKKFG